MSLFRALLAKRRRGGTVTGTTLITVNDITVAEDAGIATFTVTRTGDTSGISSVDYATTQFTAFAGQDYVTTSGTLTFTAGQTSKTVDVTVNNTSNYELNELFYLDLTSPVGATITKSRGICTLTDVSGFPSASSVTSPTAGEGNNITFRVTFPRLAEFGTPHTYVLGGTAIAGTDYNFTPVSILNNVGTSASSISATSSGGSFTCPVNTSWVDITFALLTDVSAESAETIILTVDDTASGTGTITDVPPPTISDVSSPLVAEGNNLVFTVTRSGTGGATINYAYSLGGTASAPSDYTATPTLSNGVTISGGDFVVPSAVTSFTATFATVVNGDNGETVILTVGGVSGTGTISAIGSTPIGDSGSSVPVTALTGMVI